jgi:hypothetical protein
MIRSLAWWRMAKKVPLVATPNSRAAMQIEKSQEVFPWRGSRQATEQPRNSKDDDPLQGLHDFCDVVEHRAPH